MCRSALTSILPDVHEVFATLAALVFSLRLFFQPLDELLHLPGTVGKAGGIHLDVQQAAEDIPLIVDWELNNAGPDKPAGN